MPARIHLQNESALDHNLSGNLLHERKEDRIVEHAERTGLNFSILPTIRRPNCSSCEKLVPGSQNFTFLEK